MGDHCHSLVDLDATASEAPELAERIRSYLVGREIIVEAVTDSVLGVGGGHCPGSESALAHEPGNESFRGLQTNGVAILQTRTVFDSGEGDHSIVCGACSHATEFDGTNDEAMFRWQDAITDWYEGNDGALLSCPSCSAAERLTEWHHNPAWGFGHFGITFWNWPTLKGSFVEEVQQYLGHRLRLVRGKL